MTHGGHMIHVLDRGIEQAFMVVTKSDDKEERYECAVCHIVDHNVVMLISIMLTVLDCHCLANETLLLQVPRIHLVVLHCIWQVANLLLEDLLGQLPEVESENWVLRLV